jgi:CysZ protein
MGNFTAGLNDYLRAQRLLFREGLWPLFLVPGILSLLYLPLSAVLASFFLKDFTSYVHENWVPDFLQSPLTEMILTCFLFLMSLYLGFLLFRNVIMILYSPILSFLSEATELTAAGLTREEDAPEFSISGAVKSALRGTTMSFLSLIFSLIGLITAFSLAMIPVIGAVLAAILMLLLTVYLAGVGFYDPPLERRQAGIGASLTFCWRNRGRVSGIGFGFTLLLMIPVVGWVLAPSYGVIAGTLAAAGDLQGGEGDQ